MLAIKLKEAHMVLYYHPLDRASRNVLTVLDFLDIDVEMRLVNINLEEHKRSYFLSLNPKGELPVLADGELVLWEAHAITQYLASLRHGTALWPEGAGARADIAKWQFWEGSSLAGAVEGLAKARKREQLGSLDESDLDAIERANTVFHRCAQILNTHLSDRYWLSGSCITLADLSVSSRLMHGIRLDLPLHA